ncbi:hypothetical protein [Bacillus sp. 165]|uniref:hypothetical protein n=1 Tax=Bacillus sp. 165 TaxID=1529117 RepID=UPI001AD9D8FD|nr:hypothetical protein [Bacillus sp. 165]MBO9130820.1 hypothetical protein [Bacillus sp. 165]
MEAKWNYQFNKAYLEVEGIEVSKELTGKVLVETAETSSVLAVTVKALQGSISATDILPLLHVKMKDMDYIKQNYLLENPTVQPSKKPSENANGKRLEDILGALN